MKKRKNEKTQTPPIQTQREEERPLRRRPVYPDPAIYSPAIASPYKVRNGSIASSVERCGPMVFAKPPVATT